MSEHIEDPTGEVVEKVSMTLMASASAVLRRLANERRRTAQERLVAEQQEAGRLSARVQAEQAAAAALLRTTEGQWITTATPEQAGEAWATARAWAEVDPQGFDGHESRLRSAIQDRWDVDVSTANDGSNLRAAADAQRQVARNEDAHRDVDQAIAGGILAGTSEEMDQLADGGRHEGNAETHEAQAAALDGAADSAGYDTDARRTELVTRATDAGVDVETAEGRGRAANANAKPTRDVAKRKRGVKGKTQRRSSQRGRADQLSR